MKRVIVPLALENDGANEVASVRSTYAARLFENNVLPVFVSPNMPWPMFETVYEEADGILLLGGPDLNPSFYGSTTHPKTLLGPEARDRFELALVERAVRERKPILGICRGSQVLAVALGGRLHQHLAEVYRDETHQREGIPDYAEWTRLYHDVELISGSRISEICRSLKVRMNSAHHQAVQSTGPQLMVTGKSAGGCVEFIEHIDPSYFCLGVQAHPEMMPEAHALMIFKAFAEALGS